MFDNFRPIITNKSNEVYVEYMDLSKSKDFDPEEFNAFIQLGNHNEFVNNMFKFKLRPQCRSS